MPGSRKLTVRLAQLLDLLHRGEDWLIMVNADPDAMAAALALKRILARRTGRTRLVRINEISRPDNLAMVRYLHIPIEPWTEEMRASFQKFALVDSQPHHNPAFSGVPFSIIVDHHPVVPEHPTDADYVDIRPPYGSTCTIFTEYLRALRIRPGKLLATAMLYGIRTDTGSFTRKTVDADIRAYQWLASHGDTALLNRITRSEYLPQWLKYFTRAFSSLHQSVRGGSYAFLGEVENPDILVVVADFFTRVHGLRWIAICGVYGETVVIIFRGDGQLDLGRFAAQHFGALGSAGGHRGVARAEFPLSAMEGRNVEVFVFRRLRENPLPPQTSCSKDA